MIAFFQLLPPKYCVSINVNKHVIKYSKHATVFTKYYLVSKLKLGYRNL